MSVNKLVSIKTPIVDAMEFLHIDHDKLIPLFTRFATLAEEQIGSAAQYELKRMVLDINQCVALLPNDCIRVEIGILGDHGDCCDNLMRNVLGYWNPQSTYGTKEYTFFVVDAGDNGEGLGCGQVYFQVQNNKLIFDNNSLNEKKITIQYLAYKTDCDGFVEIGQNHVNAIREYIVWSYLRGKPNKSYIDRDEMNTAREEWNRECAHARAMDALPTPGERQSIVAMTHNPLAGISLRIGMYTTLGGMYNWYS